MENDEIRVKAEIEGQMNSTFLGMVDNPEDYHSASSSPSNELNSEDDDDDNDNDEDENRKDENEGEEYVDFSTYIEQSYDHPDKKSQKRKAEDDNMSLQSKQIKSNNMLSSSQRAQAAKATEEESPFWPKADIGSDPVRKSRWSESEQRYFAGSGMGSSKLKELLRIGAAPPSPQVEEGAQVAEQKDIYKDDNRDDDDLDNTDKENIFDNTYLESSNKEIKNQVNDVQGSSSRLITHKPPLRDVPQEAPPGYDQDISQAGKPDVKNYDVIKRMKKCIEDLHIVSLDALMEASGESSQFIDSSAAPFKRLSQIMAEHSRWLETFVKVVEKKKHNEGLLSP